MKTTLTLVVILCAARAAFADPLAADEARRMAMITPAPAALELLLTDEMTYTHSNGLVQSKADLLEDLESGVLQYVSIDVTDVQVQAHSGVGIVTGRQHVELRVLGEPITSNSRYTATYVGRTDAWRLASYQSTSVVDEPGAMQIPRQLSAAFNERDVDAMVDLVAEDVKWFTVDEDDLLTELEGSSALSTFLEGYFNAIPSVRSRVAKTMDAGRFVAFREHVRWTNDRGEQKQYSLGVAELDAGKIARVWYFAAQPE